ncbi:hypothetical protein H6P81_021678 [Aristolochia fimbriata]|uniref:Uncharacterized protein n=1 Tax=Aristolochia fimbriata TaxID=158543 RepID=A0AAV7DP96_ARIFI|nr:hypothetical protein H6P81_021678 [Aristolochia fimbriata]
MEGAGFFMLSLLNNENRHEPDGKFDGSSCIGTTTGTPENSSSSRVVFDDARTSARGPAFLFTPASRRKASANPRNSSHRVFLCLRALQLRTPFTGASVAGSPVIRSPTSDLPALKGVSSYGSYRDFKWTSVLGKQSPGLLRDFRGTLLPVSWGYFAESLL